MVDGPASAPKTTALSGIHITVAGRNVNKARHVRADRPLDTGNPDIAPARANVLITALQGSWAEEIEPAPSLTVTNSNVNGRVSVDFILRPVQRLPLVAYAKVDTGDPFILEVGKRPAAGECHDAHRVVLAEFLPRPLSARGKVDEQIPLTGTGIDAIPAKTHTGMRTVAAPVKTINDNAVLDFAVVVRTAAHVRPARAAP